MSDVKKLLEQNREWAANKLGEKPDFFNELSEQQAPKYFWIGCSDSRVPANQITGLMPGEVFVHRNVANVVSHVDLNCLSVMQFAVEVLKVEHIIVCGHYGCGGVNAALSNKQLGLIDSWLTNIKDVYIKHEEKFKTITDESERSDLMCELNVIQQAQNVCESTIVQDAWKRGQKLSVHGWCYSLKNGHIKDLEVSTSGPSKNHEIYQYER
ncbi:carbonate dehydratase [Kangiella spongicola]|uniref:Carbonic anhydrase n=1 Tax=Kangiella spongicola TaxID=796379 RepID=A0A318DEF2_9GAMM|nr:carbonate dehydratase [Kangiella spongicola]MBV35225.1 carbonate dehydratase [Rickettsiales bacterium]PXF64499.1 carbonate dehydratase [Kangiella spongicola]